MRAMRSNHDGRVSSRGLSLQEILIVVAVFSILAAILVFSSDQAMTRARVSRVKGEEKMLAGALHDYRTDNSEFPPVLTGLLGPVRYLEKIPTDPFIKTPNASYTYYLYPGDDPGSHYFIVVSAGPDGVIDFDPFQSDDPSGSTDGSAGGVPPGIMSNRQYLKEKILRYSYDPTNGVASKGDIIRLE